MAGFIRRYPFFPGIDQIRQIEGVVIVDLPAPGQITGIGVGTVAMVGEYPDCSHAVSVSGGVVSTLIRPVEVTTPQDLVANVGGFDSTLGEHGVSGGNAFVALRNKKFSRLVCVPVNIASAAAVRLFRQLPTNTGASTPTPVVPMTAASVAAGTEFKSGANRVHVAAPVAFSDAAAYDSGTDGSVTSAGAAAFQNFTSAGGDFLNKGVQIGDAVVIGQISGAGALGANADTFRVRAVTSATVLVLEKLDGSSFDWTSGNSLPWRIHPAAAADTGLNLGNVNGAAGYTIPARPLDAAINAATSMAATTAAADGAQTSWDPLSGLRMLVQTGGALDYTAATQAANAVASSTVDALYTTAIDALLAQDAPARDVNIVVSARHSSTIRTKLKTHEQAASAQGIGRICINSPSLSVKTTTAATADADPGVGANRDERITYGWPGALTYVPEAVNISIKGADGAFYTDGNLDTHFDAWIASVLSVLPPERNPGEATDTTLSVLSSITGYQRGVSGLKMADYILLKQKGVCALRLDRRVGPIIQSGITSSLTSGKLNINRRRMADFIEDSVADAIVVFAKQPLTNPLKDGVVGEIVAFLDGLLSPNNANAQRISGYLVDDKSGNTPQMLAAGIFVIIGRVQMTPTGDEIVFQAEVGETVNVTAS